MSYEMENPDSVGNGGSLLGTAVSEIDAAASYVANGLGSVAEVGASAVKSVGSGIASVATGTLHEAESFGSGLVTSLKMVAVIAVVVGIIYVGVETGAFRKLGNAK